jgi:cytochrome b561
MKNRLSAAPFCLQQAVGDFQRNQRLIHWLIIMFMVALYAGETKNKQNSYYDITDRHAVIYFRQA